MDYPLSLDSAKYSLCSYFSLVCSNTQQPAVIPFQRCIPTKRPLTLLNEAVPGTVHTCSLLHAGSLWDKRFQCSLPQGQCQQGDVYQQPFRSASPLHIQPGCCRLSLGLLSVTPSYHRREPVKDLDLPVLCTGRTAEKARTRLAELRSMCGIICS